MLKISDSDFIRLTDFIIKNYGINLKAKRVLIEGRLWLQLFHRVYRQYNKHKKSYRYRKNAQQADYKPHFFHARRRAF